MSSDVRRYELSDAIEDATALFNRAGAGAGTQAQDHASRLVTYLKEQRTRPPEAARGSDGADLGEFTMQDGQLTGSTLQSGLTGRYKIIPAASPSPDPRGRSGDDPLRVAAGHAADVLAEIYAKYSVKIGPFATQAQKSNGELRAALAQPPAAPATTGAKAASDGGEAKASSMCPMDGKDYPHSHHVDEVIAWLEIQAARFAPNHHIAIFVPSQDAVYGYDSGGRLCHTYANALSRKNNAEYPERIRIVPLVAAPSSPAQEATSARAEAVVAGWVNVYSDGSFGHLHEHESLARSQVRGNGITIAKTVFVTSAPPEVTHGAAIGGDVVTDAVKSKKAIWVVCYPYLGGVKIYGAFDNAHDAEALRSSRKTSDDAVVHTTWLTFAARATASTRSDGVDVGRDAK